MKQKHLGLATTLLLLSLSLCARAQDPSSAEAPSSTPAPPNVVDQTTEIPPSGAAPAPTPSTEDQENNPPEISNNEDQDTRGVKTAIENNEDTVDSDSSSPTPEGAALPPPSAKTKICNCRFTADVPYSERRSLISGFFGLLAGLYTPVNYKPDFATNMTYANYYEGQQNPNAEVVFGAKVNFFLGSIGPQITAGFFSAQNPPLSAHLNVSPVTAGLIYAMDNIFKEPYVVPYVVGGMYSDFYTETVGGLSVTGNTPFAAFYSVGMMFQLDWMDTETHATGYDDFGLENTFLFIEGRSFLQASNPVPDFSTPLQFSGGIRVEF